MPRSLRHDAARALALRVLRHTAHGELVVHEPGGGVLRFGVAGAPLRAELRLHDDGVWAAMLRGSLGIGETYADGRWSSPDLVALVALGARNMPALDRARSRVRHLMTPVQGARNGARNTVARARRQIAAHYDLSNDLFGLFLDPTMSYSSAVFTDDAVDLESAQVEKIDRLCRKLELRPGLRLVEIGTGWGALAIHAAREYGAHVTTTTISREQHALARRRIDEAGLGDRIDLRLQDYRELEGTYDRLVSVEMIEAVGWRDLPTFFRRCDALLNDEGLMALQAITIADDAYELEKRQRSFINTMIFPGGCLPSQRLMGRLVRTDTRLAPVGVEDLTPHYAETLHRWRAAFNARIDEVRGLGYDERFERLWDLYLAYCEAGFRERRIQLVQAVYRAPGHRSAADRVALAATPPAEVRGVPVPTTTAPDVAAVLR
jgi:cyclopropane-fatty-acyl-phospholipid synthase